MGQILDFFKQAVFWLLLILIPTGIIIWFVVWCLINCSATEDISETNTCCDGTEVTGGTVVTTTCNVAEDSCSINTTLITGGQLIETECNTNDSHAMLANSDDCCAADDNTNSVEAEITTISNATVINTDENGVNSDCCAIDKAADDNTKGKLAAECDTNDSHAVLANSDECCAAEWSEIEVLYCIGEYSCHVADDNTNSVQAEITTISNATVINANSDNAADDNSIEVSDDTEENVVNSVPEKIDVVNQTGGTTIVRRARRGRGRGHHELTN